MNTNKKIVLAGGSGFLGRVLADYFSGEGWEVVVLTRFPQEAPGQTARRVRPRGLQDVRLEKWDGKAIGAWQAILEGATALVNLAGKSVNCRYHRRNRKEILDSRIDSTRVLGEAIGRCKNPPKVWVNASTATIYKHTFGHAHEEAGEIGATPEAKDEFSIEVATAWERVFDEARVVGTRKVAMRTAMVLGMGKNSVFPVVRRLARLGLGGRMGSGKQYVSWVHELDFCRAVEWLIEHEEIEGVVNIAAPKPVTNVEMMRILREVCGVRFGLPALRWMLEVGSVFLRTETELVIKSRRVVPGRLKRAGFEFRYPEIRGAFEELCGRREEELTAKNAKEGEREKAERC
jgi:uncharacterized protein (TIGR01777 family)